MKTVYSDLHRLQDGQAELIDGKLQRCHERPERADLVLARVREVGLGEEIGAEEFGLAPIRRVHDAAYLRFLETAWDAWVAEHGAYDALPLNWPTRGMRHKEPRTIDGKLSYFSFDAGTPITAGTWRAATAAANVALTGAKLVADGVPAAGPPRGQRRLRRLLLSQQRRHRRPGLARRRRPAGRHPRRGLSPRQRHADDLL